MHSQLLQWEWLKDIGTSQEHGEVSRFGIWACGVDGSRSRRTAESQGGIASTRLSRAGPPLRLHLHVPPLFVTALSFLYLAQLSVHLL